MENEKKEWQKKNSNYCSYKKDVSRINEGIATTEEVWKKYQEYIQDLMGSDKIKDQVNKAIENRIEILNKHWQDFKKAGKYTLLKLDGRDYDPFDPNVKQQTNVDNKQNLQCFAKKISELHQIVRQFAYTHWFEKLYQFLKTNVLKLYNALFAGPKNISGEKVYINAANYAYGPMSSYRPKKHNFFICHEALSDNIALLQEDLTNIENWQKASQLDRLSPKR